MCIIPKHFPNTGSTLAIYYFDQNLNITTVKEKCCKLCRQYNTHWQNVIPVSLSCKSFYYRSTINGGKICRAKCGLRDTKVAPADLKRKDENNGYAGEGGGREIMNTKMIG